MGEAFGHLLHQSEIGGLDLQMAQAVGDRAVFDQDEHSRGGRLLFAVEGGDGDLIGAVRLPDGVKFVIGHRLAGLEDLENLAANDLGEIIEIEGAGRAVGPRETAPRHVVGMEHVQVPPYDDAPGLDVPQYVKHHFVPGRNLVVPPDVLDGQAQLFEQMEDQRQFIVGHRLSRQPLVEHRHAHKRLPVQHRDGDARAQQIKFALKERVPLHLIALPPQHPARAK